MRACNRRLAPNPKARVPFAAGAPRSQAGDSLKDFAPAGRLFANRCSFLIYSDSFAALAAPLQECIFEKLRTALTDDAPQGRFAYLEADEKRRIIAILRETLPEAKQYLPTHL